MSHFAHVLERLGSRLALEHLRAIEWDGDPDWPDVCPICGVTRDQQAHRTDCRLAHAINALVPVSAPRDPSMVW